MHEHGERYDSIRNVFKRDPDNNHKTLLEGEWDQPVFSYLSRNLWRITEKIDGTNIRIYWDGDNVQVFGRSDNANLHGDLVEWIEDHVDMSEMGAGTTLYGEGFGPGIQNGGNYGSEKRFVLFDVWYKQHWLEQPIVQEIAKAVGIKSAPDLGGHTLTAAVALVKGGFNSAYGDFTAEGVVARPLQELTDNRGNRVITKIKCVDFVTN